MSASILIVEDERSAAEYLRVLLEEQGYPVRHAGDGIEALIALEAQPADLVISDLRMPRMDGLELLTHLRERWPDLPVIVLTADSQVSDVVEAVQLGAINYLVKPATQAVVIDAVEKALVTRPHGVQDGGVVRELIGESRAMVEVRHRVVMAARSDVPVLITGETGTGKELVSRAIHAHSKLSGGPFVAYNCAVVPRDLFESEFFGHRRGAFTGADRDHTGLLQQADEGVLFLDELETLALPHQAKLLRVIDDGEVRPVGDERSQRVSVRFLAATNRDSRQMIEQQTLREDLYYRLRGIEIRLPPLRERVEDIPLLADHFAGASSSGFTIAAREALARAPWPGNVRQLRNVVESARASAADHRIDVRHLALERPEHVRTESGAATDTVARGGAALTLREAERQAIVQALESCGGNRSRAARALGIDHSTLRRKIQDYGVE